MGQTAHPRRRRRERELLTPYGGHRIRESFFHCTDINSENVQYQVCFSL
nr:MAG TPA: Cas system-associated protein [Caudoviricetes sp.]